MGQLEVNVTIAYLIEKHKNHKDRYLNKPYIKFCGNAIASLPIEPNLRTISIDEINNQLDSLVAPC
jgi:hypothetical protein